MNTHTHTHTHTHTQCLVKSGMATHDHDSHYDCIVLVVSALECGSEGSGFGSDQSHGIPQRVRLSHAAKLASSAKSRCDSEGDALVT